MAAVAMNNHYQYGVNCDMAAVEEALTETDRYAELAKLGVKVEILKSWNPSQDQLETLLAGLKRLYRKQN